MPPPPKPRSGGPILSSWCATSARRKNNIATAWNESGAGLKGEYKPPYLRRKRYLEGYETYRHLGFGWICLRRRGAVAAKRRAAGSRGHLRRRVSEFRSRYGRAPAAV